MQALKPWPVLHLRPDCPTVLFVDRSGRACRVEHSSLANEPALWVGLDGPTPIVRKSDAEKAGLPRPDGELIGWMPYPVPEEVLLVSRMHLARGQVRNLVCVLQRWLDTGSIESPAPESGKPDETVPVKYRHVYEDHYGGPLTKCPNCGDVLTADASVQLETSDGVRAVATHYTKLDAGGELQDVCGLTAAGRHAGTRCARCGDPLDHLEREIENRAEGASPKSADRSEGACAFWRFAYGFTGKAAALLVSLQEAKWPQRPAISRELRKETAIMAASLLDVERTSPRGECVKLLGLAAGEMAEECEGSNQPGEAQYLVLRNILLTLASADLTEARVSSLREDVKAAFRQWRTAMAPLIQAWLEKTRGSRLRPRLVCGDGISLSVQASRDHYCCPRDNVGPYSHVEVGPSANADEFASFAERDNDGTVFTYACVPVSVVEDYVLRHGGFGSAAVQAEERQDLG